jgi:thymidylate kinase
VIKSEVGKSVFSKVDSLWYNLDKMRPGEKPQPVVFFEGADGTFKTTNALLFAGLFRYSEVFRCRVAYVSLPVYQTPFGRLIGNFLGRWGDKIESLPPRETALLYALNRLEILSCVKKMLAENYLLVFNRSPYSNLYNLARKLIETQTVWSSLSRQQKGKLVDETLSFDREFLQALAVENRPVSKLFLHLEHEEAMAAVRLCAGRDGRAVDLYESDNRLQETVVHMYQDIALGEVAGHNGELVPVCSSGRLTGSSFGEVGDLTRNAYAVWQAFNRSLGRNPDYYF